jgi:hypothetical protein
MYLSTFYDKQVKSIVSLYFKYGFKYMKVRLLLIFWYFQVDGALQCINVFSKISYYSHILSKSNVKVFLKSWKIS